MIHFTDTELIKLSEALEIPLDYLQQLYSARMLNERSVINVLIKHDYKRLRRMDKYRPDQIMLALGNKYQVSGTHVRNAIFGTMRRIWFCEDCHKEISAVEYNAGQGKCKECFAKTIEV